MKYLFDSDIVIDVISNAEETIEQVEKLFSEGVSISTITYIEAYQGILEKQSPQAGQASFDSFLSIVEMIPVTENIARRCALIRVDLKRRGRRFRSRSFDLIIAATALERDLILVTRNRDDYDDIPGLVLL